MHDELLKELIDRLPELEWKINGLGSFLANHRFPRGLFRADAELGSSGYIAEIKRDIYALSIQKNERSAFYLAEKIKQKINVLVALCQIHSRKEKNEEKVSFGIKMLGTRQQWIKELETNIFALEEQQQALRKTLEQKLRSEKNSAILCIQAELGEVERRLTLAKETFNRAVY